jgi:transcriptional regulator with GAF, ATPase, and Fis domain
VWLAVNESLALAGSAGTPSGGGSHTRRDGEFREMAVADSKIREITATRDTFVVRGVRGDEDWLTNSGWAARQGVRAFIALPLVAEGHETAVGALAVFDREMPNEDVLGQLRLIADICALRVVDLRAREATVPVASGELLPTSMPEHPASGVEVVTRADLRRMEKENIEAALAKSGGRVFGQAGAAALLGMRPTTLASRIKALGIERP